MICSIDALRGVLRGTAFEGRPVRELWQRGPGDPAYVIELGKDRIKEEWALLRSMMDTIGRYPVVTLLDDIDPDFFENIFSTSDGQLSWSEKIAAECSRADPSEFLSSGGHLKLYSPTRRSDKFEWLDSPIGHSGHPLGKILQRFGDSPSNEEVRALHESGRLRTDAELERWLLDWEIQHFDAAALLPHSTAYLDSADFRQRGPYVAVLVPTPRAWEALLYMGWDGLDQLKHDHAVEQATALRVWQEKYGAELVGAFLTTLHVKVATRPQTISEAFDLAMAHYHFASDTMSLSRTSIRDHARALLSRDEWYFHSRP